MSYTTTYTQARANLAKLCNKAALDKEVIIINRRGAADIALIAAQEVTSLLETAHLLRSPKNAKRLISALHRTQGKKRKTKTLDQLKKEMGLEK